MQLMRMIACSRSGFLQRSGMLLRCVHVLHNILPACPFAAAVRTHALGAAASAACAHATAAPCGPLVCADCVVGHRQTSC